MDVREQIDEFVVDLLHVNDISKNKLLNLNAGDLSKTYYLSHYRHSNFSKYILDVAQKRMGKPGNTVLRKSATLEGKEQILGEEINDVEWCDGNGDKNAVALRAHIASVYGELSLKGNNPLFLSVGSIVWVVVDEVEAIGM